MCIIYIVKTIHEFIEQNVEKNRKSEHREQQHDTLQSKISLNVCLFFVVDMSKLKKDKCSFILEIKQNNKHINSR